MDQHLDHDDDTDERIGHLADMLERTVTVMAAAAAGDTSRPTPCHHYDVAGLLEHLALWAPVFEAAVLDRSPPYDPTDRRVEAGWDRIVADAADSIVPGLRHRGVERPMSLAGADPIPGEVVLNMMLAEYIGHGWDLCRAIGVQPPYTDSQAEVALVAAEAIIAPEYRGADGMFGDIVELPAGSPAIDRLVGFLGRDPAAVHAT